VAVAAAAAVDMPGILGAAVAVAGIPGVDMRPGAALAGILGKRVRRKGCIRRVAGPDRACLAGPGRAAVVAELQLAAGRHRVALRRKGWAAAAVGARPRKGLPVAGLMAVRPPWWAGKWSVHRRMGWVQQLLQPLVELA